MGISYTASTALPVRTGAERATLVRRTYALVFASILVTIGGAALGVSQPGIMLAVAQHPFITLACVFAPLFLAMRARDQFPMNVGLVALFAFAEGIWLSPYLAMYARTQPGVLTQAALLTGSTFAVLTMYATASRRDFSAWGSFFVIGLWVLLGTSLMNLFFHNETASLWIAAMAVFVFGGLLVYDTWRIRNVYGPDDYVPAAVTIYLDLLNLFLAVLRLLGGRRR